MRAWHAFYPEGIAPGGDYPAAPVWEFLAAAARALPGKIALVDRERTFTYAALWERVESAAGWIRARGAGPGDRVLLRLPNVAEFPVAYYGGLRAGCIVVPASPALGIAALAALRADTEPALEIDGGVGAGEPPPVEPFDVAVLQQTSGTSGRPKAAIMTHANLVANALQNARWFSWTADEINLAVLPLCHTWGMCVCLNSTFAVQGTVVLARRFDAPETLDLVAHHGATVLYGSTTMFHRLLDAPFAELPTLRHVKAGAMLTQGDLKRRWDARYPHAPMQQGYGLTEASPECHNNPPRRFRAGTVGVPIQDTDCRLVDAEGRVVGPGESGEVCLQGPQITRGYWRQPEETARAFVDGWLRTGDVGVMDADGYLTIVDRLKDMLKFRGYTVSPNRVEEALLAHDAVAEAVVVGRRHDVDGEVPTAFVVLKRAATDDELLRHCRALLARYEVPREVVRVDAIPRNAVGKPLRRELRARL